MCLIPFFSILWTIHSRIYLLCVKKTGEYKGSQIRRVYIICPYLDAAGDAMVWYTGAVIRLTNVQLYVQQWNISFRIKRAHHLYFNHPTPPSPLKEKEEENERWWRGASYIFFLWAAIELICSWEAAFCVLLDTLWHWQPKDPAGCYLWELSFFSLSLNSVLCVYHCLPCACLYARLMPPY